MSENSGKLQIVIKGGKPWGFRIKNYSVNRSTVVVDNIEPGGKAEMHGGLKTGDHIIKINDVFCLSLSDAIQLIDSAFRTLTILVWRPSFTIHSDKSACNSIELQPQICSSPTYFVPVNNKLSGTIFQKFKDIKCNTNTAIAKQNDKQTFSENCNDLKSDNSLSSLQYHHSDVNSSSSQYVDEQKISSLHKLTATHSLNSDNFQTNSTSSQEYYIPPHSHQSANLQYICEQYPLSELFLNYKSDLKLESLASKKNFKTYQNQELDFKHFDSARYDDTPLSMSKESDVSKTSACLCCMYPKCHSLYKKCKIHSPPERDLALSQTKFVDKPVCSQYINSEHKLDLITLSGSSDDHSTKKLNSMLSKNSFKIKEDGFKNSDLKIFKPVELTVDSEPICFKSYNKLRWQRKGDVFYQEQVSHFKGDENKNVSANYYVQDDNEHNYDNVSKAKMLPSDILSQNLKEHTVLVNHTEQNEAAYCGRSTVQEAAFELHNQNSSSRALTMKSYHRSYLNEEEHSVCHQSNNSCLEYLNETNMANILSTESSVSDGDEDEELCLIEENARNSYSCVAPHYSSTVVDLPLPPPPPINDDKEIFASNEPLPSPPSFTPVKEIVYENIEINKKSDEAIYANLEMLKIKCSVVNSATQTTLQRPSAFSELDSKQMTRGLSFIETEIFSKIVAPTVGNKFRSDYLRSYLKSQIQKHSLLKENLQTPEEKYLIERHALSLPVTSAYFTTSEPKAKLLTRYISNLKSRNPIGGELTNKKEELITSINKKLGILRLEKIALKEEMKQNDELGCLLTRKLEKLAQPNEVDKFRVHVGELEKITNLMISLSGRLARAENALLILPSDTSSNEKIVLEEKYSKLNKQYDEAKYLKKNIDRRNYHMSMLLQKYFTEEEFTDYDHFTTMKAKLLVDYREIDEKIKLGEEQLDALKSSVNFENFSKLTNNS